MFAVRIMVIFLTKRLNNVVEAVTEGKKLQKRDRENGIEDEFDIISNKLIEYSDLMQQKNEEELEKQRKVAELELMLLQERISPHFLYNTLSSIKWAYQNPELSRVIDSMVKYYRVLLNRGSSIIALGDELVGVEEYLKIQKFVYEKEFDVEILCSEELRRIRILKSLLQPIAENAFVHGLNSYEGDDGFIRVSVDKNGDVVRIMVENNGIIISDEAIAKIFDSNERTEVISGGSGYAMKNIIKRIKLYYGDAFGVEIHAGNTTTVTVTIPYSDGQVGGENNEKNVDC